MRKITKIVAPALIAAMGLGVAMPASAAAPYHRTTPVRIDNARFDNNARAAFALRSQIDELQRMVNRNDRRDRISEREARGLRQDVWQLRRDFNAYSRNGLSDREARTLQFRVDRVKAKLHHERNDRNDRNDWNGHRR